MRKGPFGKTNHPMGYWWLVLIVGQFITIAISVALNSEFDGRNSPITIIFDFIMLSLMPVKIKKRNQKSNYDFDSIEEKTTISCNDSEKNRKTSPNSCCQGWTCPKCNHLNPIGVHKCQKCGKS